MPRVLVAVFVIFLCLPALAPGQALPGAFLRTSASSPGSAVNSTVSIGWLEHVNGLTYTGDYAPYDYRDKNSSRLSGLWLDGSFAVRVTEELAFNFLGGYFFSSDPGGSYEARTRNMAFSWPFDSDSQWGIVEATGRYAFFHGMHAIAGFRWDHFTTWRDEVPGGPTSDRDNFVVNAYLPVLGVEAELSSSTTECSVRLLGFPSVPGYFTHEWHRRIPLTYEYSKHGFSDGYFLEVLAQYRKRTLGTVSIGAFARFNVLHASTGQGSNHYNLSNSVPCVAWSFHRQSWTFGGSLAFDFNLF